VTRFNVERPNLVP